jgi:hypothetical protein
MAPTVGNRGWKYSKTGARRKPAIAAASKASAVPASGSRGRGGRGKRGATGGTTPSRGGAISARGRTSGSARDASSLQPGHHAAQSSTTYPNTPTSHSEPRLSSAHGSLPPILQDTSLNSAGTSSRQNGGVQKHSSSAAFEEIGALPDGLSLYHMTGVNSSIEHEAQVIMALNMPNNNTVGCAYYNSTEERLYFMQDCKMGDISLIDTREFLILFPHYP